MLRRSFLSRLSAAASFAGVTSAPLAAHASPAGQPWEPAHHPQDDWYDQLPGKHRFFFDTTSAPNVGESARFADNFLEASKSGYGLEDRDSAVIICLRHRATPFAFTDAIWAKYGKALSDFLSFTDPKTKQAPSTNVYAELPALAKRGVHFAVCDMATRAHARIVAEKTGGDGDAIYKEMVANAIPNSHFVAAGIVAVNRAQEHGYAIAHVG